jgi:CheY-like chemotaxis protein
MKVQNSTHSILLVDDDQLLRDMYSVKFREKGFSVEQASGAAEALERLRAGLSPDIVLFDVVMPGTDGYAFLEALAKEKLAHDAVKIALSNQGADSEIAKAKTLGAQGYIVKANSIPSEVVAQVMSVAGIK